MFINVDPDEFVIDDEIKIRDGAIEAWSYKTRKATPEEYKENRRKRLAKRKLELEQELDNIQSELLDINMEL